MPNDLMGRCLSGFALWSYRHHYLINSNWIGGMEFVYMKIEIDVDCFPKLSETGFLPYKGGEPSVGRAMKDLFFAKYADIVISNVNPHSNLIHTIKTVPPCNIAVDFYMWDYQLDKYRSGEYYLKSLEEFKAYGINKCVGMDFSLWFEQPEPTLINNLYLNMLRLKQAQDAGFQTIFNWNNVMSKFQPVYERILPNHVPIVMADNNHSFTPSQVQEEVDALYMFRNITKVDLFIIQSSKQDLSYMRDFLHTLVKLGISYCLIPSQTALLGGVRRRQEFDAITGVKSTGEQGTLFDNGGEL